MATLPPWLAIDPVAPVGRLLEGYRAGLSASEAQNASARAAQAQAAQAQQMALAQAQAEQLNAYRQQQQAIQLEQLRMEQQKAERDASSAALQLEGQRGIQAELDAGANWPQALAKWAPKLFAGKPDDLARAMQIISPPQPPIFGTTPEGIPYAQDPRGGNVSFPPVGLMRQGTTPQPGWTPEGIEFMYGPSGEPKFPPRRTGGEGDLTKADQFRLKSLEDEKERYQKVIDPQTPETLSKVMSMSVEELRKAPEAAALKTAVSKVQEIQKKMDAILGPTEGDKKPDVSPQEAVEQARAKIMRISQNMPEGPARQAAIAQVIARLRQMGIQVPEPTQPTAGTPQQTAPGTGYNAIRGF